MAHTSKKLNKLPGWIGIVIITLLNTIWLIGDWGKRFMRVGAYRTPLSFPQHRRISHPFSLAAIRWPYVGGGILIAAGIAFAIWWLLPGINPASTASGLRSSGCYSQAGSRWLARCSSSTPKLTPARPKTTALGRRNTSAPCWQSAFPCSQAGGSGLQPSHRADPRG